MKRFKLSTVILGTLFSLLVAGVFASDLVFKDVYDKRDKSDLYWNYNKILEQPYKYLKIDGGNLTTILFEQNSHPSVRILNNWNDYKKDSTLKVYVKNDTLFLKFQNKFRDLNDKYWMAHTTLIRLAAPQLLSVEGHDTNFELQKLRQDNISINLRGQSRLEVETYQRNFDTVNITQRDSSEVIFEVSPDLKGSQMMHFKHINAYMTGYSLLDVGRSYVDNTKLNIADSSAIILSGRSLRALPKNL